MQSLRLRWRDQTDWHGRCTDYWDAAYRVRITATAVATPCHVQNSDIHVSPRIDLVDEDLQKAHDCDFCCSVRLNRSGRIIVNWQRDDGGTASDGSVVGHAERIAAAEKYLKRIR